MHLLASDSNKREQPKGKQTGNLRSPLGTDGGLTQRKAARPTLGGEPQRRNLGNTQNHLWSGSTKAKTPTFTPQPKCCRSLVDRAWTCVDVHALTHQPVLAEGFPQHLHSKAPGTNAEGES